MYYFKTLTKKAQHLEQTSQMRIKQSTSNKLTYITKEGLVCSVSSY